MLVLWFMFIVVVGLLLSIAVAGGVTAIRSDAAVEWLNDQTKRMEAENEVDRRKKAEAAARKKKARNRPRI
jgi:hypothetical protein